MAQHESHPQRPQPQPRLTLPLAQGVQDVSDPHEQLPLADAYFRLAASMRLPIWQPCAECRGQGYHYDADEGVFCGVCGAWWWREEVRQRGHVGFRITRLPCTHEYSHHELEWTPPPCEKCETAGGAFILVTLDAFVDWMLMRHIPANYDYVTDDTDDDGERISQIVTARHRAV